MVFSSEVLGLFWDLQTVLLLFVILFTAFFAVVISVLLEIENLAFGCVAIWFQTMS